MKPISEQSKRIWEDVKANLARLDACSGPHDFQPVEPGKAAFLVRHKCTKCGGDVDAHAKLWYQRGLKDGRLVPEGGR